MNKLLGLLIICLLAMPGCSRYFGSNIKNNSRGDRLDTAGSPAIQVILINYSEQPIFCNLQGLPVNFIKQFDQVNPGDTLQVSGRSFQNIKVTIAWWCEGCQNKLGYSQEELLFSMPGLYTGQPIIITDLMLRQNSLQTGVIVNVGEPVHYQDDRGNSFVLQTDEYKIVTMPAGALTFFTRPPSTDNRSRRSYLRSYQNHIDLRKKETDWRGELYDFKILLHERWSWR